MLAMRTPAGHHSATIAITAILFLLTFSLQFVNGARWSELAHGADEPAHVVSALMIHDYLSGGAPTRPMQYAETYYAHYPKLAIGIWPPLLYFVAAIWMFPFGVSRLSLLLLSATFTAGLAVLLALFVRRRYGTALGLTAGILFIALHSIQFKTGQFMLDIPVALISFVSMLAMEWYFESGRPRAALAMAFVISAGLLVKGNSIALILMVALMLLATRRVDLLRQPPLYVAGAIILMIGLPWQLVTLKLLSRQNNVVRVDLHTALANLERYSTVLLHEFTIPIAALVLAGLVLAVWRACKGTGEGVGLTAAACLFVATVVFHCIVPVVGSMDSRYMTAALAPGLVLFMAAVYRISCIRWTGWLSQPQRLILLLGLLLGSAVYLGAFRQPNLTALGFSRAADVALAADGACCTMLVSSDSMGEGAFISEVAFRDRALSRVTLRATKMISESPWNGQTVKMLFQSPAELAQALDANAVDVIVVDRSATEYVQARELLLAALRLEPQKWNLTNLAGGFERSLSVYSRINRDGLAKHTILVPMPYTLGRPVEIKGR